MRALCLLLLLTSCSFYDRNCTAIPDGSYLIVSVDAKHLDYSSTEAFILSMSLNRGEVGHAWLTLRTPTMMVEGGHSGERGIAQPRYCDAIQNNLDYGYSNPTDEQKKNPRFEPNPIKCLWDCQPDGYFQRGSGRHRATYAALIPIDDATAEKIAIFIKNYPFSEYSLTGHQCTAFCVQAAAMAGLNLEDRVTLPIDQHVKLNNVRYCLWRDPVYSQITFSSPDVLERNLKRAVKCGLARQFP